MSTLIWILFVFFILGLLCIGVERYMKDIAERDRINDANIIRSMAKNEDWDEEWLRQVKFDHTLIKISQCKVGLLGRPPYVEGMLWVCKCGADKGCMNLETAKLSFNRHLKDERDKALAALGRFE